MTEIIERLVRPFSAIGDALEIRRLQRRLPFVYRRLISEGGTMRAETDGEYLDRLREIHDERYG
jgi:hypothetical protein